MAVETKAYVISEKEGGTVVHDLYAAVKAEGSQQLRPERQAGLFTKIRKPLLAADQLARLLEVNTYHARAVKTKARDVAGLGWSIEPIEGLEEGREPKEEERAPLEALFDRPHPELTLEEILHRVEMDLEATGNGYLEIVRGDSGSAFNEQRLITGLAHVPAHTVFRHEDMDRYVQMRGRKKVWFRPAGELRELDSTTGRYEDEKVAAESEPVPIPAGELANDLIHFMTYNPRDDYYGLPDVVPALMALSGDMERAEYVNEFFENNCVPRWMLTIVGADIDSETRQSIEEFFHKKLKENARSTMIMTVAGKVDTEDGSHVLDANSIKVDWQALDTDVHEASFRLFRKDNRDELLVAHGVPGYRVGVAETGALGGNFAREATTIYKQSVVEPRQRILEARINRHILWDGFGALDWEFRFADLDDRDEIAEAEILLKQVERALRTPNQAREALGLSPSEHPAMDLFYMDGEPITAAAREEAEEGEPAVEVMAASLRDLHRELLEIVSRNGNEFPLDPSLVEEGVL